MYKDKCNEIQQNDKFYKISILFMLLKDEDNSRPRVIKQVQEAEVWGLIPCIKQTFHSIPCFTD